MNKIKFTYIMLLFTFCGYSQNSNRETTFWKLNSYNGEVWTYGSYWDQITVRNGIEVDEQNSLYSGGLILNTNSFFYHPNFLLLDFNIGYSPNTGQRLSLVTPDRNETHTLKQLYVKTTFFQKNDLNFNMYVNFNENYSNRENLTNIRSKFKNIGGSLNYFNKYVPISVSYNSAKGEQKEIQTKRIFRTKRNNFDTRATKSFGKLDRNEFRFSYNEYAYEDTFFASGDNLNGNVIENNITSWSLNNNIFFDSKKNYSLNSRILSDNQIGNINFKRFQILENIFFRLPKNFKFHGNYNFYNLQGDIQDSRQHNMRGALSHQLYKSLRTSVFFEYNTIDDTQFKDKIRRTGLSAIYDKDIPLDGHLTLTYRVSSNKQIRASGSKSIIIQNEIQTLIDGQLAMLNSQNINKTTVVVRDITNTIIYQLNFDYILIERSEFLEIRRVPGGQIANNTKISIDYVAVQPLSYQFNAINSLLGIRIALFKNLFEVYTNTSKQDYINVENSNNLTLNYFNKNVYGSRFNYKFASGGIEYDNFNSTIIPYRLMKYYLVLQGNINQKINYSLSGEILNYFMIEVEGNKQNFYNISGNISYLITPKTRLNLEGGYRKQEGNTDGINLDLLTTRFELITSYRQVFLTAAAEYYQRELSNERFDFNKVSLKISRRF